VIVYGKMAIIITICDNAVFEGYALSPLAIFDINILAILLDLFFNVLQPKHQQLGLKALINT